MTEIIVLRKTITKCNWSIGRYKSITRYMAIISVHTCVAITSLFQFLKLLKKSKKDVCQIHCSKFFLPQVLFKFSK